MCKGVTMILVGGYCKKTKRMPHNTEKQVQKIVKFKKKLNDEKIYHVWNISTRQNISAPTKKYKEVIFYWTHIYKGEDAPGQRISEYGKLLKRQKIRFRKTMDDDAATFTWDTSEVSFL